MENINFVSKKKNDEVDDDNDDGISLITKLKPKENQIVSWLVCVFVNVF